jgi:hypothetical protein
MLKKSYGYIENTLKVIAVLSNFCCYKSRFLFSLHLHFVLLFRLLENSGLFNNACSMNLCYEACALQKLWLLWQ